MLRDDMSAETSGTGDLHRSLELLWRGRVETARGPRPGLTLDAIVDAGVALADREGIDALSMRRVATELGVGTMTLYRYVPGKGELLDLMLDRVATPPEDAPDLAPGAGWRATLEAFAQRCWRVFLAHPWLLQVNQSRQLQGPRTLAEIEPTIAGLDGLGLCGRDRVRMLTAVAHAVDGVARGYVLQHHAIEETGVSDDEFSATQGPVLEEAMATGRFPHLAALDADSWNVDAEAAFDTVVTAVLDGLERFVATHGTPP